ncbi:BNR-4 repeat-containing protein [Vibrio cionasavignyae]|uniref:BNR-4 repeat-containing protein n=1 Tax=Vibrio cionasavignyae TaxID=2910252 RepID=UPI003D0D3A5A
MRIISSRVLAISLFSVLLLAGCDSKKTSPTAQPKPPVTDCKVNWQTEFQHLNRTWQRSRYDHNCSEVNTNFPNIKADQTANQSLNYQNIFDRERELYGYNPRFIPGRPYFDANNLPWMIVNNMNQFNRGNDQPGHHQDPVTLEKTGKPLHALTYDDRVYSSLYPSGTECTDCDSYLVRLTANGEWVSISLRGLEQEFGFRQNADGLDGYRYRYIEQVYFRDNGDVFFKLDHGVVRYQASTNTWQGYSQHWIAQTEMVGNGQDAPLFVRSKDSTYTILRLVEQGNDELEWQQETLTLPLSLGLYRGSHPIVWEGNTLHIAAMSFESDVNNRQSYNTGQYYVRYQLGSEAADVMFMGWSGSTSQATPDSHNQPIILIDSHKRLHYISGAHNHQIWHRYSLQPVTNTDWNSDHNLWGNTVEANDKFSAGPNDAFGRYPEDKPLADTVNYVGQPYGRYTYIHAVLTNNDDIYLAMRNTAPNTLAPQGYRLEWVKGTLKSSGQYQWQDQGVVVMPNWQQYSNYTQKLHQDKRGNLFLLYTYEIQNFKESTWFNTQARRSYSNAEECALATSSKDCINTYQVHYQRWPNEELAGNSNRYSQAYQHDPVLLVSSDNGQTWQPATTAGFIANKIP